MSGTDPIIPTFYSYPREPSADTDLVPWARDLTRALQNQTRTVADRANVIVQHGTAAQRPTADGSRRLYYSTDTDKLSYDSGSWVDVGAGGAFVKLQAATPGTVQTGNTNISGAGIVGTLNVGPVATPTEPLSILNASNKGVAFDDGGAIRLFQNLSAGDFFVDINRRTTDGVFGNATATHSRLQMHSGNGSGYLKFFTTNTNNTNAGGLTPVLTVDGGGIVTVGAVVGIAPWPSATTYGYVANSALSQAGAGNYALLMGPNGDTYLNAVTGQQLSIRRNNTDLLLFPAAGGATTPGYLATQRTAVALVNGANNDVAIGTAGYVCITGPTGAFSVSGFAGGVDGRRLMITSEVAFAMTITNDAGSSAANRIYTGLGADQTGAATLGVTKEFIYNATLSRWCLSRAV